MCPIQTHLFQLPAQSGQRGRYTTGCMSQVRLRKGGGWFQYGNKEKSMGMLRDIRVVESSLCVIQYWPDVHQHQVMNLCCTHRDLFGVSRSYSTWCLSGMRGRMASNKGNRFGSLMTSFRSPTSTVKSIDLKGEERKKEITMLFCMFFLYTMNSTFWEHIIWYKVPWSRPSDFLLGLSTNIYIRVYSNYKKIFPRLCFLNRKHVSFCDICC